MPVKFTFDKAKAEQVIRAAAAARLEQAGRVGVETAKELVPVDTGKTRDSIGMYYNQTDMILTIFVGTSYSPFLEFGTHKMPARPFMRPAAIVAGNVLAGSGGAVGLKFEGGRDG